MHKAHTINQDASGLKLTQAAREFFAEMLRGRVFQGHATAAKFPKLFRGRKRKDEAKRLKLARRSAISKAKREAGGRLSVERLAGVLETVS